MDLSLGEPVGEKSSSGRQFMKGDSPPPPPKTKGHGSAPQPPPPRGLLFPVNESFKELKRPSLPQRSGVVGTGWEPTNYYPLFGNPPHLWLYWLHCWAPGASCGHRGAKGGQCE